MKLAEHTEHIRQLIDTAFRNRLGRMGITAGKLSPVETIPVEYREERKRTETIREVFIAETGTVGDAYEKLVEELTFTFFNRLAALKVMEAHTLHPEIVTQRESHGSRSFAHLAWLEQHPEARNGEADGLVAFFEEQLSKLAGDIPLFSPQHPYHLLPTPVELKSIINAFNQVETDKQVETEIWKSDDVLGWLYESYNNKKKQAHKDSKADIEFNHVSLRSQTYTPRWVVKFLVDNSLGKLYLEMYPNSEIKSKYKIANAPKTQTRERKPITDIRLIDPSNGSGNFLLYSFDLYYDLYLDNISEQGNPYDYDEADIAKLIIEHNLHGIDLDDRAVQLAQLGLYIKAKRKRRTIRIDHFNVVSSDFFLPEYKEVKHLFENGAPLDGQLEKIVIDLWNDLQQAYKFGSLIRLEEKFSLRLHGLVKEEGITLFTHENLAKYEAFRESFFTNLQKAVAQNTARQGLTFLNSKTQDAITFLQLLTQKYDVAVANPPYTDSADFGPELKKFIEANYKLPYKFNTNLYASFIKRCCELVDEKGKIAIVHPPTFMYIKTFEDVRKYLLDKTHISLFVEWGYLGMFNPVARVDSAMYILENEVKESNTQFIKLNGIYEGKRYDAFVQAYNDLVSDKPNKLNISLPQSKLKIIEGWPFIYWISDEFRKKFKNQTVKNIGAAKPGLQTGSNEKFVRYWWEVNNNFATSNVNTNNKWIGYAKGGDYNKWAGNLWLKVNWENDGEEIISYCDENGKQKSRPQNRQYYFKLGITYSASGSRGGTSFRILPENNIFDVGGASIFLGQKESPYYALALFNSKISNYILDCLNPTANFQKGDIDRLLYFEDKSIKDQIISLSVFNVKSKYKLLEYSLVEETYRNSPLFYSSSSQISNRILDYLNFENLIFALIILSESIIDQLILDSFDIPESDIKGVVDKQGNSLGGLPLCKDAKDEFLRFISEMDIPQPILDKAKSLELINFPEQVKNVILAEFESLYKDNNDIEGFCNQERRQNPLFKNINPINVWYWFRENRTLPLGRATSISLEFLADALRMILMEDEDGIIPLVGLPGEPRLLDRLEQHCLNNGFTSAQYMQLDGILGRPLDEYIEQYFFKNLSDRLNLFMYFPKTPFIWHLSSGGHQGFEVYIIIYKWNRDSLFKLKSHYLSKRVESLEYRKLQIQNINTAQALNEKEQIRQQVKEIESFTNKIDELIAEGYNPKLDDGVGKNIAPLQNKGLLKAEVLNPNQLKKYLNADW